MTKDEALKLALEALELNNDEWKSLADSGDCGYWNAEDQDHYKQTNKAITAIKQALAAPAHKPLHPEIKKMYEDFFDKWFRESSAAVPENFMDALMFDTAVRDVDAMIALARSDEREACAKVIESHGPFLANGAMLAEAIRARGNT